MRVLHISTGSLFGGVETLLLTLAHGAAELRHDLHFAMCSPGQVGTELQRIGVTTYDLGEVRLRAPLSVWSARSRLAKMLKETRFDSVVCHLPWTLALFGPVVKKSGQPLVYWTHQAVGGAGLVDRLAQRVDPDLIVCVSKSASAAAAIRFPRSKRAVCYPPIPSWRFLDSPDSNRPNRLDLRTPAGATVILQVSRMEPGKGHEHLLRALAALPTDRQWEAWIVGGPQREPERQYHDKLIRQAEELGLAQRVRFLGQRCDVAALIAEADIFCHPNVVPEGFGLAYLEALHGGLPVVGTAIGGTAEFLSSDCALLVPPGEANLLSASLLELMESAELRARLAAAGKARALAIANPGLTLGRIRDTFANLAPVASRAAGSGPAGARVALPQRAHS